MPECVVLTYGAAAAGLAAGRALTPRLAWSRDRLVLAGGLGSLVFAAQAVNIAVWPGVSGHLVGGVLLAGLLGPGLGAATMALVLLLQALWLGDGGLAALGANVLNMALVPAALVALLDRGVATAKASEGRAVRLGLLGLLATPLAALLLSLETALLRPAAELAAWPSFAALLVGTHLWIGVLEGLLTTGAVWAVSRFAAAQEPGRSLVRPAAVCLAVGLAAALLASPWASSLPDGYEAAALASGQAGLLSEEAAQLAAAGPLNVVAAQWQQMSVELVGRWLGSETWLLAGATLLLAAVLWGAAGIARRAPASAQ